MKDAISQGYLRIGDTNYIFTYEDGLLQIVPQDPNTIKEYHVFSQRKISEDIVIATSTSKKIIVFLKCIFHMTGVSGYISRPAGYVEIKSQNYELRFDAITFKGEIVNNFYKPIQIIDKEKSASNFLEDGSGNIVVHPFTETTKYEDVEINSQKAKMTISICSPSGPDTIGEKFVLGATSSLIRIEFEEHQPIERITTIYSWIKNFFMFLNFRSIILFDEIILSDKTEDKKISPKGNLFVQSFKERMEVSAENNIGFYMIKGHIGELLNILNNCNLNMLHIPPNKKEDRYLDPIKFLSCCSSFESIFSFVFPNQKSEDNPNFKQAKADVIEFIKQKDSSNIGVNGKIRKEYNSILRLIELMDFSLEKKIDFCIQRYYDIIFDNTHRICLSENLINVESIVADMPPKSNDHQKEDVEKILGQIPHILADCRNLLAHDSIIDLERLHVVGYLILQWLTYCMILDKCDVDKVLIKNAINNLFMK